MKPKRKRRGTPRTPPKGRPIQPGEVRNPTGANGWTKARERVREILAECGPDVLQVMERLAKSGDVQAAKLILGPLLPPQETKTTHEGEIVLRFEGDE